MNELSIYRTKTDDMWEVTFASNTRMKGKLMKLAEAHPDEVKNLTFNKDGSVYALIPLKWVKLGYPRVVSDEFREQARERLNKLNR